MNSLYICIFVYFLFNRKVKFILFILKIILYCFGFLEGDFMTLCILDTNTPRRIANETLFILINLFL